MTISTEDLQGIEENRQLLAEDPSGVGSQWRDEYEWLQELFDKLTAENEGLRKRAEEAEKQIQRIHRYDHMQDVLGAPMRVKACGIEPCTICRRVLGGEG